MFKTFDHMARQDDDKRRKELEGKMRREDVAAAAGQELEASPVLDANPARSAQPPGGQGAVGDEALGPREDAGPPGADTGTTEAPRGPPAAPR